MESTTTSGDGEHGVTGPAEVEWSSQRQHIEDGKDCDDEYEAGGWLWKDSDD